MGRLGLMRVRSVGAGKEAKSRLEASIDETILAVDFTMVIGTACLLN
jgi:hypothetical protein